MGCALSVLDVAHPGRGVLYAVVRDFPALSSKNRNFAKALSSAGFAAGELTVPPVTGCPQHYRVVIQYSVSLIVTSRESKLARVTRDLSACRYY